MMMKVSTQHINNSTKLTNTLVPPPNAGKFEENNCQKIFFLIIIGKDYDNLCQRSTSFIYFKSFE
jgi:hypothetical protein